MTTITAMKLSDNFTLAEAVFSSTALRLGISNVPSATEIEAMKLAAMGMELVRYALGNRPIHVDSWFRCGILNGAVGGSRQSAHMKGHAIDFTCNSYGTPLQIVRHIASSGIKFDQCIQEGGWVHISFAPAMRGEILTAHFTPDGNVTYSKGLV